MCTCIDILSICSYMIKTPSYQHSILNRLNTSDLVFILFFILFSYPFFSFSLPLRLISVYIILLLLLSFCLLAVILLFKRTHTRTMCIAIIFALSQKNFGFYYKCCNFVVRLLRRKGRSKKHQHNSQGTQSQILSTL